MSARTINPVTGGSWEGTGVTPDVTVNAADAFDHAHQRALQHILTLSAEGVRRAIAEEARTAIKNLADVA